MRLYKFNTLLISSVCVIGLFAVSAVQAQVATKPRITRPSELPAFSYALTGNVEAFVRAGTSAPALALSAAVRRDLESVLSTYDIADAGLVRSLKASLTQIAMLDGRNDDALRLIQERSALTTRFASRVLTGINPRAMIVAQRVHPDVTSPAYADAVGRELVILLRALPYDSVQNDLREAKAGFAYMTDALIVGELRGRTQELVDKQRSVTLEIARDLVATAYTLRFELPIKPTLAAAFDTVVAGRTLAEKADIWKDRSVTFTTAKNLTPVVVGIWDSGLDTTLFSPQLLRDARARPVIMGFNQFLEPENTPTAQISPVLMARRGEMTRLFKGMSDLDANMDTPDARFVRDRFVSLPPDSAEMYERWISQWNGYSHGTAVASVAVEGNPAARILLGRMQFSNSVIPDPCPSRANAEREARILARMVQHFRTHKARVVNMSWMRPEYGFLGELERCAPSLTAAERAAIARYSVDTLRRTMIASMRAAPEILFVAAAGNAGQDTEFNDFALRIDLPNMLIVGAVDRSGDVVSFTNTGPLVKMFANGYLVETRQMGGGGTETVSGTSFAAPGVVNTVAKMLAVQPTLTTGAIVEILFRTSDTRGATNVRLLNPARAVADARVSPTSRLRNP